MPSKAKPPDQSLETLALYLSQRTNLVNTDPISWRTRDPIYNLLYKREMLKQEFLIQDITDRSLYPPKSRSFPIEETLSECEEKTSIIHQAFDAAAFSILRTVLAHKNCDTDDSCASTPHSPEKLPQFLIEMNHANNAKKEALAIVSNKRKASTSNNNNLPGKMKQDGKKRKDEQKVEKKEGPTVQLAGYSNFDSRSTISRAILCAAASLTFKELTPKFNDSQDINVSNIPQNQTKQNDPDDGNQDQDQRQKEKATDERDIDMDAVTKAAEIFAKRVVEQVFGAVTRAEKRRKWRIDCARSDLVSKEKNFCLSSTGVLDQFFRWKNLNNVTVTDSDVSGRDDDIQMKDFSTCNDDDDDDSFEKSKQRKPIPDTNSDEWNLMCLPRLLEIMNAGAGHVVLHDMQWTTRFYRILQLLTKLATPRTVHFGNKKTGYDVEANFGPHLIITTERDLDMFVSALGQVDYSLSDEFSADHKFCLRGLRYHGSKATRRRIRIQHFTSVGVSGLPETPYNIIVTTYTSFVEDYLHFTHIPFQSVVLDDGMSWLGAANSDPNGKFGKAFHKMMWSKSDDHGGLAGVQDDQWNFALDIALDDKGKVTFNSNNEDNLLPKPRIGLTARHRILVASALHSKYREVIYSTPVPALLSFLLPQFTEVVKEEFDRSRIHTCEKSMEYMRMLLCRGIVVYQGSDYANTAKKDEPNLAISAMTGIGAYEGGNKSYSSQIDKNRSISTDKMISEGRIMQSRRLAASWIKAGSAIRQELGNLPLDPLLSMLKLRSSDGCICEEIIAPSSASTNNQSGSVPGNPSFRTALRCGREFGSEQGMRQHLAALHAPPGTWLCRTCSIDCGTSQSRTHHERSCSSNTKAHFGILQYNSQCEGVPSIEKSKVEKRNPEKLPEKDEHGNVEISSYVGVWENLKGNYFIKLDNKPLLFDNNVSNDDSTASSNYLYFDCADDAAKMYDKMMKERKTNSKLNFNPDGTRTVLKREPSLMSAGRGLDMLGGGASSVVPALSVINIKDLPKGVVPLLRDPKQTSRVGGNAKRFIYMYRGVCRQVRKGHDRWQSQISFGGTNHYLGTFDSEWDAAAIYAWAHLILYGEDATKKAQQEGEDAVAAYEQEKKDIAEGKIVATTPIKKKKPSAKGKGTGQRGRRKKSIEQCLTDGQTTPLTADVIKSSIAKMGSEYQPFRTNHNHDSILISGATERILASQSHEVIKGSRCISITGLESTDLPYGHAALIGLSSASFEWSAECFVQSIRHRIGQNSDLFLNTLAAECSLNNRFRSLIQGTPCFIGKAPKFLEKASGSLGFYGLEFGGTIGHVDCNIGGIEGSCSDNACCISYSEVSRTFKFRVCGKDDIVTVNGKRITTSMGNFPISSGDICSVGARVFMFILPSPPYTK